ncbi:hypothetical protein C8R46DRAFT_1045270 [Mycena filopes]|nr:hypothetical protein C8R46DRAFT_1045270 [Mycena filopes]
MVTGTYFLLVRKIRETCTKFYETSIKAYKTSRARKARKAGAGPSIKSGGLEEGGPAAIGCRGSNGSNGYGPQFTLLLHHSSVNMTVFGGTGGPGGHGIDVGGTGGIGGGPIITAARHTMPTANDNHLWF